MTSRMNSLTLRALKFLGFGRHEEDPSPPRRSKRSYLAGKVNRLNRDWPTIQTSPRAEVYVSLRAMRARMRFLAKNSDYMKRFLSMYRNNVAGPYGMKLQVTGGTDAEHTEIQRAWKTWSKKKFASASGHLSLTRILRRICTTHARDGEVLIRKIYGKNSFGLSLKFYDPAWLDETYNETRPGGNRVIMSVEVDDDERPVAYWLTPPPADFALGFDPKLRRRTRIPAEEIFHLYLPDDENFADDTLTRGVPPGHTASLSLFRLDKADEANLISLQAGASKMGFFTPPEEGEDAGEVDRPEEGDETLIDHFEPGTFWKLPPGYQFNEFNPDYPNQAHDPFAKYMLRRIAVGLDVFYHSLTGDLKDVNLSTIRAGLVDERDMWKALQEWLTEFFCEPLFSDWLKFSVLAGAVKISAQNLDRFEPTFMPRRWSWPDPLKDVQTQRLLIEAGLATITDGLAEMGEDLQETFAKRKTELELAKRMGIPLAAGSASIDPNPDEKEKDSA